MGTENEKLHLYSVVTSIGHVQVLSIDAQLARVIELEK